MQEKLDTAIRRMTLIVGTIAACSFVAVACLPQGGKEERIKKSGGHAHEHEKSGDAQKKVETTPRQEDCDKLTAELRLTDEDHEHEDAETQAEKELAEKCKNKNSSETKNDSKKSDEDHDHEHE